MIRRTIPKHIRQQVYEKYGGCCAYRCIKEFEIAEVNKNGIGTGSYFRVEVDSLWSLKKRINCIGGENHLKCEDLLMGSRWIAISDEALARFFEE